MSPSSSIRRRVTKTRGTRYQVRYRLGRGDNRLRNVATFDTLREARACKQWVDGELAAGRRPDLHRSIERAGTTVADLAESYGTTQTSTSQHKRQRHTVLRLGALADRPVEEVTGREIQEWVLAQHDLAATSLSQYLGQLRRIFDWGEVSPNPAAWSHLKVPGDEEEPEYVDPPEWREFLTLLDAMAPAHREVVVFLEGTGMRISEALRVTWGDIDWERSRIRVPGRKTQASRRWVPLWGTVRAMLERTAPEDRLPHKRLFSIESTDSAVRGAMRLACKHAGLRHFHPHDLRDRFITLLSLAGVPLPLIRDISGHRKNTVTLDIYTGVILHEPHERLRELRHAVGVMTGLVDPFEAQVRPGNGSGLEDIANSRENLLDGGYRDRIMADLRDPSRTADSPAREGN